MTNFHITLISLVTLTVIIISSLSWLILRTLKEGRKALSEINKDSALRYLREFILYWKDKGSAFTTWNSKFIEHVKRRHIMSNEIGNDEENKKYSEPGKYKKDFKTRKNDNTWAKEINLD